MKRCKTVQEGFFGPVTGSQHVDEGGNTGLRNKVIGNQVAIQILVIIFIEFFAYYLGCIPKSVSGLIGK